MLPLVVHLAQMGRLYRRWLLATAVQVVQMGHLYQNARGQTMASRHHYVP